MDDEILQMQQEAARRVQRANERNRRLVQENPPAQRTADSLAAAVAAQRADLTAAAPSPAGGLRRPAPPAVFPVRGRFAGSHLPPPAAAGIRAPYPPAETASSAAASSQQLLVLLLLALLTENDAPAELLLALAYIALP